jgi:hypothetical protein
MNERGEYWGGADFRADNGEKKKFYKKNRGLNRD